jgi:holo-[acyl-carrier protein] synthase
MIVGTGLDIVEICRIQKIYGRFGDAFAKRILCEDEYQDYKNSRFPERFLARRFAAKEAVAKALGTGFSLGLTLPMICVGHDESGRPIINLYDMAKDRADSIGAKNFWISISDERRYATAFAVMEG